MHLTRPLRTSILAKTTVFIALFSLIPLFLIAFFFIMLHNEFFWPALGILSVFSIGLLGVAFGFAHHLIRPIRALMRSAERISKGDFSTVVDIQTHDELQ